MYFSTSWKFLLFASSLCQLGMAQSNDACYQLKPASQRAGLVCEKYGTPKRDQSLGPALPGIVDACIQHCIDYPNNQCKSFVYDRYLGFGCQLEGATPKQLGYNPPMNPDEWRFISNIKCYQRYPTTGIVNGNFSQGKDPWLSYGPVTFDSGTARMSVAYNKTYPAANRTRFQISQGLLTLCPQSRYELIYTQLLEHVKGTIEVRLVDQSNGQVLAYLPYNISQPNADASPKRQTVYPLTTSATQGATYAVVLNGDITTTRANPAKNPANAVVEWDDFVLNRVE